MPDDRLYYTYDDLTISAQNNWTVSNQAWARVISNYVTTEEMDRYLKKIYEIFQQFTTTDISEEEFINLIKEDS